MQLGMKEYTDVATGVQEEFDVEIEANAVAIYAQISGLAKDKVGYAIRELPTNAWDESRGNFEVHLPTRLNPIFRVRDYGPGISPENMRNVYGKLYASTKRAGNEKVGGWGLGSKSPFAYLLGPDGAGSFNVTSYHQGVMRAYVISLSDQGKIKVRVMAEMPSDEPSGLDVSYAVRRDDIDTFHNRASSILWSFNPRPRIFPEGAITWKEPVVETQGDNWIKYDGATVPFYGPHVRMGCVMYPIDLRQIQNSGFLDQEDDLLFDAPIGSLKVTLSREELAYDETTKTTLTSLVKQYEDSFLNQLREKIGAAETMFEAAQIFEDETDTLGQTRQQRLRSAVNWNGRPILIHLSKDNCKMDMLPEGWQHFDKFEDKTVRAKWPADAKIVIEHNPSYSFSRFHMAELVGQKVLWVRCKRIVRDQVLAALGNPEVIDLDSFKVPVAKRVSKTIRKRKTLVVTSGGRLQRITQDVDLAEGGLMVESHPGMYRRRRGGNDWYHLRSHSTAAIGFSDVESFTMTMTEFGLLEVGTVILVKAPDQEIPGDWGMLADDMVDDLRAKVNVEEFTGLYKKNLHNLNHYLQEVGKMRIVQAPEDVTTFLTELRALMRLLSQNSTAATPSDKAIAALKKIGVDINRPEVACPIEAIEKRYVVLCNQYMLLKTILETNDYSYRSGANKLAKLNHYFELLSRPEVANDNDEIDEGDELLDLDDLDQAA
jgi:hypothetical protein